VPRRTSRPPWRGWATRCSGNPSPRRAGRSASSKRWWSLPSPPPRAPRRWLWAPTTTADAPGANDNGTGVAAVLELARLLADLQGKASLRIRFVRFVNEEPPFFTTELMGSLAYARRLAFAGLVSSCAGRRRPSGRWPRSRAKAGPRLGSSRASTGRTTGRSSGSASPPWWSRTPRCSGIRTTTPRRTPTPDP
jgi:hypothetical protein